jgi:hypothetical protein
MARKKKTTDNGGKKINDSDGCVNVTQPSTREEPKSAESVDLQAVAQTNISGWGRFMSTVKSSAASFFDTSSKFTLNQIDESQEKFANILDTLADEESTGQPDFLVRTIDRSFEVASNLLTVMFD